MRQEGWVVRAGAGLMVAFLAGCSLQDLWPGAGDKEVGPLYLPPSPKVEGPRIDATPVAKAPPFVGEDGIDVHGYPRKRPDMVAILNMLRLRRFDTLERWMTHYQEAFEQDHRKEHWPDTALSAFFVADPSVGELLDEWVAASGGHFAPYLARGNFRFRMGGYYRGDKWAHQTSVAQFASQRLYEQAAARDFAQAKALRPQLLAADRRLIQMASSLKETEQDFLEQSSRYCPDCYGPRLVMLLQLTPRWGGSLQHMKDFVASVRPLMTKNTALMALEGMLDWERCRSRDKEDPNAVKAALAACARAVAAGEEPIFLIEYALVLRATGRPLEALTMLERALRVEPQNRQALRDRYFLRAELKDYLPAARDMVTYRHVAPMKLTAKQVQWMVDTLRYEGDKLQAAGKVAEAVEHFSLGLQLAPDDVDLRRRSGWAQKEAPPEALPHGGQPPPDDFEALLNRDHMLAARGDYAEVVRMWDGFITAHP